MSSRHNELASPQPIRGAPGRDEPITAATQRGFTLIELMVAFAIIGIGVSIGAAFVFRGRTYAELRGVAREVEAAMAHTRAIALQTNRTQRFVVDVDGRTYSRPDAPSTKQLPAGIR